MGLPLGVHQRLSNPEWERDFAARMHGLTEVRGRNVAIFALMSFALSFLVFDYVNLAMGHWDVHSGVFRMVFIWRLIATVIFALYLALHLLQKSGRLALHPSVLPWFMVLLTLGVGVSFAIVSQFLMADLSIYALGVFVSAGLLPMPTRTKLLLYPVAMSIALAGVHSVGMEPLVWRGTVINTLNVTGLAIFFDYLCLESEIRTYVAGRIIQKERERSDRLLRNVMPDAIAERLKRTGERVIDRHPHVTVLFADLAGFTQLASNEDDNDVITLLEDVFGAFDRLCAAHGVEKIKTIGDAYMAACGVPEAVSDHIERVADLALAMQHCSIVTRQISRYRPQFRIGIHTGPVIAGIIGERKFAYDLWGDTVNIASRLESSGSVGTIHVSEQVLQHLQYSHRFIARGLVELKGKGALPTYELVGKENDTHHNAPEDCA